MYPPAWLVWVMVGASTPYVISAVISAGVGAVVRGAAGTPRITDDDADRIAAKVAHKINTK